MKTKYIALAVTTALFTASAARASLYDITFAGSDGSGNWTADGQVDVNSGVADSGFLDVSLGSTTVVYNYLAIGPLTGIVSDNMGDNLPFGDNLVDVSSPNNFVDITGLLFLTAPDVGSHSAGSGVYLSATAYGGELNLNGYGSAWGWGVPNANGTGTITAAVPEPSTSTAGLSALIAAGFIGSRRFLGRS